MSKIFDVVIIGAGAAGVGAARAARTLGLSYVVLEAMPRVGGRAYTDRETFGFAWDQGGHWLHSASINPLRMHGDDLGIRYRSEPVTTFAGERGFDRGGNSTADQYIDRAYGRVMDLGARGEDLPLSVGYEDGDAMGTGAMAFRAAVAAEWGVDPEQGSTLDSYRYRDTHENWPVEDGYGTIVERLADGLNIELGTPVAHVDWSGPRVKVHATKGSMDAKAVLVTASTSVLANGSIRFTPSLPVWKETAFEAVPLGRDNKVCFQFADGLPGVDGHMNAIVPVTGHQAMSFQLMPFGMPVANGFVGGSLCRNAEDQGEAALIEVGLVGLRNLFGNDIERHIIKSACSAWGRNPWTRGAYAASLPGQAHHRANLNRPVEDRLYFAGEAGAPSFFSTVHGAFQSGIDAVRSLADAHGLLSRTRR